MTPQEFNTRLAALVVHQMDGPPRAYFEIVESIDQRGNPAFRVWRFVYTVVQVRGSSAVSDAALWQTFFDYLVTKLHCHLTAEPSALVFWRCRPAIEQDGALNEKRLYARLCIPGIDFQRDVSAGRDNTVIVRIDTEGYRVDKSPPEDL